MQHRTDSNNKIRFYAKMTQPNSETGNTLKSGYPKIVDKKKIQSAKKQKTESRI